MLVEEWYGVEFKPSERLLAVAAHSQAAAVLPSGSFPVDNLVAEFGCQVYSSLEGGEGLSGEQFVT